MTISKAKLFMSTDPNRKMDFDWLPIDLNWCPDCGEPFNLCHCDEEYREWEEEHDWENLCDCGRPGSDVCGFCGNPLCHMCFECGAGFCHGPHTQEQIDEYAKSYGGQPDVLEKSGEYPASFYCTPDEDIPF